MKCQDESGETDELAALFAVGALPDDEFLKYADQLDAGGLSYMEELRLLDPVVETLVQGIPAVAPASQVRDRLMARVARDPRVKQADSASASSAGSSIAEPWLFIKRGDDGDWEPTAEPGVSRSVLYIDHQRNRYTALYRMSAGSIFPEHDHPGPEECFVLEGDLRFGEHELKAGDYQRCESDSRHQSHFTREGCLLLITANWETVAA